MGNADLVTFVQEIFACTSDVAASVARHASDRRYPARATLIQQGDPGTVTFLLIDGRAHALVYGLAGQLVLLHEFGRGDIFGAIGQSQPDREDANVTAIEKVRAAVFLARDFLSLAEAHACISLAVSRVLLKRLRETAGRMLERTTVSASGRVYIELLRLARLGDGRMVRPAPVNAALAVRINSTRETVSRTINALVRRGIVKRERGALVIVAPQRLEDMIV
jgi:CRP-like cAMP-binding protein